MIRTEYALDVPLRTVGEILKRWGYTPKRPHRKSRQQDPAEIRS